jgi:hypothetical protein
MAATAKSAAAASDGARGIPSARSHEARRSVVPAWRSTFPAWYATTEFPENHFCTAYVTRTTGRYAVPASIGPPK